MTKDPGVAALEEKLDAVLETLLKAAKGSRCTLRVDDAAKNWNVGFIIAEAIAPGVKSLRGDGSIDQRAAATVHWMVAEQRNLIQPDLINNPDPSPPAALMSAYAAKAQMLAPLFNAEGFLQGWISVHYVETTQQFTAADEAALNVAKREVAHLLGMPV